MKTKYPFTLCILLIISSCLAQNNNTKLLEKCTAEINSVFIDVNLKRFEECNQSDIISNNFYEKDLNRLTKIEAVLEINDFPLEYVEQKNYLINISKNFREYLNMRKKMFIYKHEAEKLHILIIESFKTLLIDKANLASNFSKTGRQSLIEKISLSKSKTIEFAGIQKNIAVNKVLINFLLELMKTNKEKYNTNCLELNIKEKIIFPSNFNNEELDCLFQITKTIEEINIISELKKIEHDFNNMH